MSTYGRPHARPTRPYPGHPERVYRSQASRPAPWWLPLIGLAAYAIVGAAFVWLAFVLLTAAASYVPTQVLP